MKPRDEAAAIDGDKTTRKAQWRQILRQRRRQLDASFASDAARQAAELLRRSTLWQRSEHIAVYRASDGEIDTDPVVHFAVQDGKTTYLPVVKGKSLAFARWRTGETLRPNRYGIGEPVGQPISLTQLDLIILPMVGVSRRGFRLGMGGGFYDRLFSDLHPSPYRLGMAYACQQEDGLDACREHWDTLLDGTLTEENLTAHSSESVR